MPIEFIEDLSTRFRNLQLSYQRHLVCFYKNLIVWCYICLPAGASVFMVARFRNLQIYCRDIQFDSKETQLFHVFNVCTLTSVFMVHFVDFQIYYRDIQLFLQKLNRLIMFNMSAHRRQCIYGLRLRDLQTNYRDIQFVSIGT